MGLFDYVRISDKRFVCSEGHDLSDEEFQSKDFGETMGTVVIEDDGAIRYVEGHCGVPTPDSREVEIYCTCEACPAFVQDGTGNLCGCPVEFRVTIDGDDRASGVERISESTADWLKSEPAKPYMKDCEGPMTYSMAETLHREYDRRRPARRKAHHERWKQWRIEQGLGVPVGREES